jgi:hypothetical protein
VATLSVTGCVFVQLPGRLLAPLVGFPERGHPLGLATEVKPAQDEVEGARHQGLGVLIAEDATAAGDDVVVQLPGRMMLTQPGQRADELERGGQGVGVILAQDPAAAGQDVFGQLPGRLVLAGPGDAAGQAPGGGHGAGVPAGRAQAGGEVAGGSEGVGGGPGLPLSGERPDPQA